MRLAELMVVTLVSTMHPAAAVTLFARYFDIECGSGDGVEVIGKIHLLGNKDAPLQPPPSQWRFTILSDPSGVFTMQNQRDAEGRLFGALLVAPGRHVASTPTDYPLKIALRDATQTLATADIVVHARKRTWLACLQDYASRHALRESRLYGRRRYSDREVALLVEELEANGGRFRGFDWYERDLSRYKAPRLEEEWQEVAARLGGLGRAYCTSKQYGPGGAPSARRRLREALYRALAAFADAIPIAGDDVSIDGRPVGEDYGDGFFGLNKHGLVSFSFLSHQWRITDPMVGPVIWLMPELSAAMRHGDADAITLHDKLVRFFQIAFGNPPNYRRIDDPDARWGRLTDTLHTEGAFSDANLGHRIRGWVTLPAIWADYNRPVSYAPYWYAGYFARQGFPQAEYMPGWSPHGVLDDLHFWVTHFHRPAHRFRQSGFQPDGTVTHHLAGASDIAMDAYGFGWLTDVMDGFELFRDLPFDLGSHGYQFIADRLLYSYDKMLYGDYFDWVVTGRSYWNVSGFREKLVKTVDRLLAAKQADTLIASEAELRAWRDSLAGRRHRVSGNFPFWVGNYMVHRRGGAGEAPYFMSVKMKNDRTNGAEDFEKVKKSWHAGSGILQVAVRGDEYDVDVRHGWDWHALPGLTEEWRTGPFVYQRDRLRGGSPFSGMASDGRFGFAAMQYRPVDDNSSAQANKAFFFTEREVIALGCGVKRRTPGEDRHIITTIDQTRWVGDIVCVGGDVARTIPAGPNLDRVIGLGGATVIHQGRVGYIVFPCGQQRLVLRGGSAVRATERNVKQTARVLHIAIDHGVDPAANGATRYHYVIIPNVTAADMPSLSHQLSARMEIIANDENVQGVYDRSLGLLQVVFYRAGKVRTHDGIEVAADRPALVQLRRRSDAWGLCVSDPLHDESARETRLSLSLPLRSGEYPTSLPGIVPLAGEPIRVRSTPGGVDLRVLLPDADDDERYRRQVPLYAGVPIRAVIPVAE